MNTSFQGSQPGISQQLQQIIQLKVQLTKCKSKLQGYQQLQQSYKNTSIKYDVLCKQLLQYQKIMQSFFQRLKKISILLDIDYMAINQSFELNSIENNNNKSNYQANPILMRRLNKINSLKSIFAGNSINLSNPSNKQPQNIQSATISQLKNEDIKFYYIQNKIKTLLQNNQQYKQTLLKYQASNSNIQLIMKEQKLIVKKLQSTIKNKQKQIQERDAQITDLLQNIQQMKAKINQEILNNKILFEEKQIMINNYSELEKRIQEVKMENHQEEEIKVETRKKCQQLIESLQLDDQAYIKAYLMDNNFYSTANFSNFNSFNKYQTVGGYLPTSNFKSFKNNQDKQYYSQSKSKRHNNNNCKQRVQKNKYQFIFD